MVGYNFQAMFEAQIVDLSKRQTVRADRLRHARPGEPVQLFTGMRTRGCRKLVKPDPICISVQHISICLSDLIDDLITSIVIDGVPLHRDEVEQFARADGFAPERICSFVPEAGSKTARANMGAFWIARYGFERFEGVLVKWEPA